MSRLDRRRRLRLFAFVRLRLPVVALCLEGCAPSRGAAYEASFAKAQRAEGAGRFAEATASYDAAASSARRKRDRDQARWDAAEMEVRAANIADALSRLDAIATDPTSEHQAEAAYHSARLRIEHGKEDVGWRSMEQVPRRFSSHGVAYVAIRHLVAHADERGLREGVAEIHSLDHDLETTELAQLLAFLEAEHVEGLGDDAGARDAYLRIADRWPYPFGGFFDDALWRASALDEKLGRYSQAVDDLERMVKERETTTIVGTYERPQYVPAMLRIGQLYRDRLHDHVRARAAFHRLYTDFANSDKRDDALWLEASLCRTDGDTVVACQRLATLVHDFPDSRFVPCAVDDCVGLERPAKSTAPRECHPYIRRGQGPSSSPSSSSSSSSSPSSSSSNSSSS
ncbi:MAG: tetratricopeptide repeat protein [Polyangiaceae bacterium]|jgi:tetratricopeptide (TPR) repeat protein